MHNVLPLHYYNNIKKLVTACYLLNQESIGNRSITESKEILKEFHHEFVNLYGK